MFGVYKVEGKLTAMSPIFHGGDEKTGSTPKLRRITFCIDGDQEEIPIISGNAIRGYLRRLVMRDLFDQLGYELDVSKSRGKKIYHAFFSGGLLESVDRDSGSIDLELRRSLRKIPAVSLFGMSFSNQIIPSKLIVSHAIPVCCELSKLYGFPEDAPSHYELVGEYFQTRKDELRDREEDEQAVQMIVSMEVFNPGTTFHHEFRIEDPTSLEKSCLARMIELWKQVPYLGGKRASGLGEVKIEYNLDITSEEYISYLKDHNEEIIEVIDGLVGGTNGTTF